VTSGTPAITGSILLEARGVYKTFGQGALATPVLHDANLSVRAGELTLLMGPSGSGKTTLISILAGLMRASAGAVQLCGELISAMDEAAIARVRRERLGFVFQTYNLFPALTAQDNVALAFRFRGESKRHEARSLAASALAAVGLGHRLGYRPADLSSGQKQRVAIARALAGSPPLVIGDEVTAALDTQSAMSVMEILRARVTQKSATLIVTHDVRLTRFADRIFAMEDGRLREERS
jgi:putative ABC transport system ATP-binding protein